MATRHSRPEVSPAGGAAEARLAAPVHGSQPGKGEPNGRKSGNSPNWCQFGGGPNDREPDRSTPNGRHNCPNDREPDRSTPNGRHNCPNGQEPGNSEFADSGESLGEADGELDDPPDAGLVGLRMFNIGTIPASVTPPRSWRRAAWFTVVASVAALAGLFAVGAVLVCPAHDEHPLVALPYFPDGTPLAAIGGTSGIDRPAGGTHRSGTSRTPTEQIADVAHTTPLTNTKRTNQASPTTSAPVVATSPPIGTSVIGNSENVVDPVKVIRRTRTFFGEVTSNAQAAAALTIGTVRDDVIGLIQRKYGNIAAIQVESISLDPNSGLTSCALRVVNKDGTTGTQRATLQFTLTGDPKIVNFGN